MHPGYGFLSEDADLADSVQSAGLFFVRPQGDSIRLMGDKVAARTQTAAMIAGALGVELRDLFTTAARTDQEERRHRLGRVILELVDASDDEALEAISEVVASMAKLRRGSR